MKPVREWTDPVSGRQVRQLTNQPGGARLGYFRVAKTLPDGRVIGFSRQTRELLAIDAGSASVEPLAGTPEYLLRVRLGDGRAWYRTDHGRTVWQADYPAGTPERLAELPDDLPGVVADVTCDGAHALVLDQRQDRTGYPSPQTVDPAVYWHYIERPRESTLYAYNFARQTATEISKTTDCLIDHVEASPGDPRLVRFCHDICELQRQRAYLTTLDGGEPVPVRPTVPGELVTHEFWWPDGNHVAYTYQDRRHDPTKASRPLAEYAPVPTHLGIADLTGAERYCSGPLTCYHSHLYVSPDGRWISGEGTDGHSLLHAGRFSWTDSDLVLEPLVPIETPYVPFSGQQIDAMWSGDSRWLLYNDTRAGLLQIHAVEMS